MQRTQQPPPPDGVGPSEITALFGKICDELGRIKQSRQGMLQYIFSGTSLLGTASVLAGSVAQQSTFNRFLTVVGFFGMFSTFALYFREVQLNKEAEYLMKQGQIYEQRMQVAPTMFFRDQLSGLSSLLIYGGAFSGWFCVGTWFILPPGLSLSLAFPVFVIACLCKRLVRNKMLYEVVPPAS